jgi:hypothetical protein
VNSVAPLTFLWFNSPPLPPSLCEKVYFYTRLRCVKAGGGGGVWGSQTDKHTPKSPLQVSFLDDSILHCFFCILSYYDVGYTTTALNDCRCELYASRTMRSNIILITSGMVSKCPVLISNFDVFPGYFLLFPFPSWSLLLFPYKKPSKKCYHLGKLYPRKRVLENVVNKQGWVVIYCTSAETACKTTNGSFAH